jgi:hypothetical protein
MAWYRVQFGGSAQLPLVQGFSRMQSKSESTDAQPEES